MDINEFQFPPPESWEQFENLCLAIFRGIWDDPTAQKNGRGGQAQHGTDIWGRPSYAAGEYHGVQCKGKNTNFNGSVTESELRDEVKKARLFVPALKHWILVTTAQKDAKIEAIARKISEEQEAAGLFRIQIYGWEDLQSHIRALPKVVEQFYRDLSPVMQGLAARIDYWLNREMPSDDDAFKAAMVASLDDLRKHILAKGTLSSVVLDVFAHDLPIERRSLIDDLRQGNCLLLEAGPGAGKTTALLQIAEQIGAGDADVIPLVIPLPEFAEFQNDFLVEISSRSSFRDASREILVRLATHGRIALICDGWNELPPEKRNSVRLAITRFRREYPKCGLIVSTRALTPRPFDDAKTLSLEPPRKSQQLAILRDAIGDQAPGVLNKARRTSGLSDLLKTPLYLIVIAAIAADGNLPDTKEEAVRRFVEKQELNPEHKESLRDILQQRHNAYLRAIACLMTRENTVAIKQTTLRTVVAEISDRLAADGQVEQRQPQYIIDALVSHHTLIETVEKDGEQLYLFQHQQIQEWYASFFVEECISAYHVNAGQETPAALVEILNAVSWSESISFAIERLSRKSGSGREKCAHAIFRALTIDPMLASVMIRRASAETWPLVRETAIRFAAAWYEQGEASRAIRFMMGTGKPEFADYVWEACRDGSWSDVIGHVPYGWLSPDSLGENRVERYHALPSRERHFLMFDMLHRSGQSGIDFVLAVARQETESKHVYEILQTLWREGEHNAFYFLLNEVTDDVWGHMSLRYPLSEAEGDFKERLLVAKKDLASRLTGVEELELLLELSEAGEVDGSGHCVAILLDETRRSEDYQREIRLFERAGKLWPEQLSDAIFKRVQSKQRVSNFAWSHMRQLAAEQQEALMAEIDQSNLTQDRAIGQSLNQASVEALTAEMLKNREQRWRAKDQMYSQEYDRRFTKISDVLANCSAEALALAVINVAASQPIEIGTLSFLLVRWRGGDDSGIGQALMAQTRERLTEVVRNWVVAIIPRAYGYRDALAHLASAIKVIGSPVLLSDLSRLLNAELAAWKQEREEREQLTHAGQRASQANISYLSLYRQAFAKFDGEEVVRALLGYIGNPDFEVEASFELVRFCREGEAPDLQNRLGAPNFARVAQARIDRKQIAPAKPEAIVILDRIDELLRSGSEDNVERAIKMATAAIQMQVGPRAQTIRAALSSSAPMAALEGLIYVMMLVGEEVEPDILLHGFNDAIARAGSQSWQWTNEWWRFDQWLKLLCISSRPDMVMDCIKKIPREVIRVHDLDSTVMALGFGDAAKSLDTLKQIASYLPEVTERYQFTGALMRIGTNEAIQYLIDSALNLPNTHGFDLFPALDALTEKIRQMPDIRLQLIQAVAGTGEGSLPRTIGFLLPRIVVPGDVINMLRACSPTGGGQAFQHLQQAVRAIAVVDWSNVGYGLAENQRHDLTLLRRELFRIYESDDTHANLAGRLLMEIENQRDEYGRPTSEPRHPDIGSGRPWPRAADFILRGSVC